MVLLILMALFVVMQSGRNAFVEEEIPLSLFRQKMTEGEFTRIKLRPEEIVTVPLETETRDTVGKQNKVKQYKALLPPVLLELVTKQMEDLKAAGLPIEYEYERPSEWRMFFLAQIMPWLLLFLLFWFLVLRPMRASGSGGGGVLSFGRSKARLWDADKDVKITFEDVAGIDEAKEEVFEIIEFLKNPSKFQRLGGRIPKGVMLVGAPGTGKTLLAKAIAGEANVPFYNISGSDFVEMFVGVGASRVRDLFRQAKENSPCLIFLDEIDAVGRQRSAGGVGGGQDEREQTLNAMLVEMDGFESDTGVIVIAATNRPDVLDHALLRPGRFDRQIMIDLPDIRGREAILKVHAKKIKMSGNVELKDLARGTPNCSGAELETIINESALQAVVKDKNAVDMDELMEARDKVLWGKAKKSRVMDKDDQWITAVHESGHALATKKIPEVEPLHKVTIIPRGMALGATISLPRKDTTHQQKKTLLGDLTVLFAGRIAEDIFCHDISTGASHDIKVASTIARKMVTKWGMSERIGPVFYEDADEHFFTHSSGSKATKLSESTAQLIDVEVKDILDAAYQRAIKILHDNKDAVERLAKALMEYEVLDAEEVDEVLAGRPIRQNEKPENPEKPDDGEDTQGEPVSEATKQDEEIEERDMQDPGLAGAGGVA